MAKRNPFIKGQTLPAERIPKGARSGTIIRRGNTMYLVISYKSPTGKRVRYARPVSASYTGSVSSRKAKCRVDTRVKNKKICKRIGKTGKRKKRNPFSYGAAVKPPKGARSGTRFSRDGVNYLTVKLRSGKLTGRPFDFGGQPPIPKGKKVGDVFKKDGVTWKVYKRKTPKGGYKRYLKVAPIKDRR